MKILTDWPAVLAGLSGQELRDCLLMLADELPDRSAHWLRRAVKRRHGLAPSTAEWPAPEERWWWVSSAWGWRMESKWRDADRPDHGEGGWARSSAYWERKSIVPKRLARRMGWREPPLKYGFRCNYATCQAAWAGLLAALMEEAS